MFTSQQHLSDLPRRQGCPSADLAELRHDLARPSQVNDGHRQRLLDLAQRVARVQALGGEYRRVSLSEHVQAALTQTAAVT